MRSERAFGGVVLALLAVVVLGAVPFAQVTKPYGAATPQAVVAVLKSATGTKDFLTAIPVITPDGLKELANEGVSGLLMVLAFSDPDDAMPGAPKPSKTELDAKRKTYKEALDLSKQILKPHGLDMMIGKPVLAADTQKSIDTALATADNVALITSLYGALDKIGPLLGMKEGAKPEPVLKLGTVTGYKITGDTATAQDGAETLNFQRIAGRWYIAPPKSGTTTTITSGPSTQSAPAARQTPAPRATATGNQPEIVVGGIQIAKVVVSGDDFSAKPFHSDNGTRLALWIKMPANQGLIEIDEDASLLQLFGDDKGSDLGGKFDSFPDEFKDGSGGVIEIESSGVPAAGATTIVAEGSVAMNVATGTRKTRVANVRLENEHKFSFGATRITMAEVAVDGENQTFTLQLPRQAMIGIKNVAFFDARGQVLEGRSTSSGYMNDAGEMGFSVKTTAKTVTLEFEAWQGQRTIKVPFKVKAGIGLN